MIDEKIEKTEFPRTGKKHGGVTHGYRLVSVREEKVQFKLPVGVKRLVEKRKFAFCNRIASKNRKCSHEGKSVWKCLGMVEMWQRQTEKERITKDVRY
ncbi:MAG: hypothetical protein IJW55_03880 [Clostridia bacterium]|nr:hypothetical protein [Clostridia bacterium]